MPIVSTDDYTTFMGGPTKVDADLLALIYPGVEAEVENFLGYSIARAQHTEYYPESHRLGDNIAPLDQMQYESVNGRAVQSRPFVTEAKNRLTLRHLPVRRENLAVWEHFGAYAGLGNDAFPNESLLVLGTDYYADFDRYGVCRTGVLIRTSGNWSTEPRSIKVQYESGYNASELNGSDSELRAAAIKLSLLEAVALRYKDVKLSHGSGAGPIISESLGNYSYTTGGPGMAQFGFTQSLPYSVQQRLQPFRSYGNYRA